MTVVSRRAFQVLYVDTCPTFRFVEEKRMRNLGLGMLAALNVVALERLPEEPRREEPKSQHRLSRSTRPLLDWLARIAKPQASAASRAYAAAVRRDAEARLLRAGREYAQALERLKVR